MEQARHQGRRGRAAAALSADFAEAAWRELEARDPQARRPPVQPRLAQAARRGAVRRAEAAGRPAQDKTGAWATDAAVLEELAGQGHALPRRSCDWRQLSKLKGTYTDTLVARVDAETGRVHTSLHAGRRRDRAGWPRPSPTCRTSRSAPRRAARSARPSSPSRATCCSAPTTRRSSCACWPTSPTSPR